MTLNLSRTLMSSKGVNAVAHALTLNKFMSTTLKTLNLAENSLKDDVSVGEQMIDQLRVSVYLFLWSDSVICLLVLQSNS